MSTAKRGLMLAIGLILLSGAIALMAGIKAGLMTLLLLISLMFIFASIVAE